eukprot:CAMPEP_0172771572 /NCGR_PEP_ID=MMETSP1074-20121228/190814_1 /TAXON_ID=2916 /ORGANISM="Ceratium fusus, Strain PA161109" /LENGTH=35 /DNA_ID= /DNA_START= /DNA_END= /DNA_ORIENTATION=
MGQNALQGWANTWRLSLVLRLTLSVTHPAEQVICA